MMQKEGIMLALLGVVTAEAGSLTAGGGASRDARAWSLNGGVPLTAIHTDFCADLEAQLLEDGLAVPEGGLTSCTIQHFECVRTCQAGTDGPCLLGSSWGVKDFPVDNKPENKLGCKYQQPGLWDFFLIENGWMGATLPEASDMVIANGMTGYETCKVAPVGTNGYVDGKEGSCVEAFIGMSREAGTRLQFEETCNGKPDSLACTAFNSTFCSLPDLEVVAIVTKLCPVMCDSCTWTTSTDTTSTTTTSITYTTTSQTTTTTTGTTTTVTGTTTTLTTTTETTTTVTGTTTTVTGTTKTTTSGTTTTTSHTITTRTTTTRENCNGEYDPIWCLIPGPEKCTDPEIGVEIREACRLMCDSCDETTSSTTTTSTTATTSTATSTTATETSTSTILVQMLKVTVDWTDPAFTGFADKGFQTKLSAAVKDFIADNSDLLMMEIATIDFDPPMSYDAVLMPNLSQSDVAAAMAQLAAALPFSFPEMGLAEHKFVATAVEQGTATYVAPLCNGVADPVDCHEEKASYCSNAEVGYLMRERCPVMCSTCIDTTATTTTGSTTTASTTTTTSTTSSSTSTITNTSTTATDTTTTGTTTTTETETSTTTTTVTSVTSTTTVTTTTPVCNGMPDPESCAEFYTCDSLIYGDKLMHDCPVLCRSCTSSTTTASTTTATTATATTVTSKTETTTTQVCNGLPDPVLCKTQNADLCYNDITSAELQQNCPVLCEACVLTTSTTTTTATTNTATTATATTTTSTTTTSTTTTSTTTATTTTPTCHGEPDPEDCSSIPLSDCNNTFVGDTVMLSCPVKCDSCPTTTLTSTTTTKTATSVTATTITATTMTTTTMTTTTSSTSSSTTTTTTTTTPVCNGMADPNDCALEDVKYCRNAITELPLATRCPVMCDACITTTSTTTTTETTATGTTTTTTPSCNGAIDPAECFNFNEGQCTSSIYGAALVKDCPLLCNTCIPTTFTTSTSTTTVTTLTSTTSTTTSSTSTATSVTVTSTTPPNCNGNVDPPECEDFIRDDCRNIIIGDTVRVGCPLLCDSCITTTFTTTTTTATDTSTTVTSTTATSTTATTTTTTVTSTTVSSTTLSTTTTTDSTTTRSTTTRSTTTKTTTTTTKSTTTATETSTTTVTSTTKTTTSGTGTSTTVTSTTETTTTATTTTTTATSTTTTPVCNGLPDPDECKVLIAREGLAICGNKIAGAPMDERCPVGCSTCIVTTSTTDTSTTTATTTTAIPECNGNRDPTLCSDVSPNSCVDSLTGPLLSAACPVLCGTCLATPPPAATDCTADPNCKVCNADTGSCQRCDGFAYLYLGHCYESASECSIRGLVPVGGQGGGKSDSGYACIAYGGTCAYDSVQSCRPPKGLGDCLAAQINGPNEYKCVVCDKDSWLVDGICRKQRICKNGRFMKGSIMSDEECACKTANRDGSVNKDCKQCELRIAPPENGGFFAETIKGQFRECGVCTNHMLKLEGQCVAPGTCPEGLAEVSWKETLGSCEAPFSCKGGFKFGGSNEGKRCRCLEKGVCSECKWGLDGHACTICKKNTYLLGGYCVSRDACIAKGNFIPIQGDGPRGGTCIKLF